jgi:hypothetical protein
VASLARARGLFALLQRADLGFDLAPRLRQLAQAPVGRRDGRLGRGQRIRSLRMGRLGLGQALLQLGQPRPQFALLALQLLLALRRDRPADRIAAGVGARARLVGRRRVGAGQCQQERRQREANRAQDRR